MQKLIIHIRKGNILTAKEIFLKTEWQEVTAKELIAMYAADDSDHRLILSILSNTSLEIFDAVSDDVIEGLMIYVRKIIGQIPAEDISKGYFVFNGKYYFIPQNIGAKEFGAIEDAKQVLMKHEANPLAAAPMLIGIFCRRGSEVYNYGRAKDRAKLFEALPATLTYALAVFFLKALHPFLILTKLSGKEDIPLKKSVRVSRIYRRGASTEALKPCQVVARLR